MNTNTVGIYSNTNTLHFWQKYSNTKKIVEKIHKIVTFLLDFDK